MLFIRWEERGGEKMIAFKMKKNGGHDLFYSYKAEYITAKST